VAAYLDEVEREAERARDMYDLVLIPGLEVSDNRADADDSAHALALGLRRFVWVGARDRRDCGVRHCR
jgi:hypothetical protein